MRVLLIDDEPFYQKLILKPLKQAGHELAYARNGREGLATIASYRPDVIIMDVRLPDTTGYELVGRLRRDPMFGNIPVIFVSGQQELDDKLKAFELGADDYLVKPFQPEELVARIRILARRGEVMKVVQQLETNYIETSKVVAVHSLRGGIGCSSMAVNLALAFHEIWLKPTVLIDAVLVAGQVAMMLDGTPSVTWEDYAKIATASIDRDLLAQLVTRHPSGIQYVAAPKFPLDTELFDTDFVKEVIKEFRRENEFVVIDTAHDFSEITLQVLDVASLIILMIAPEMASLRAAICAMNTYDKLDYGPDKVLLALNNTMKSPAIKQSQIEKALGRQINLVIPYDSGEVNRAINFGDPFLLKNPESPVSVVLEDTAYALSNDLLKNIPPAAPTMSWRRVTDRLAGKK
jgi:pilus assembly protein CpaE